MKRRNTTMKTSFTRLLGRVLFITLLAGMLIPAAFPLGVSALDPNKTKELQPAELVSGDYAYVSDLYWITNQAYSNGSAMRDTNCAGEYIWSCDLKRWEKGIGIHAASSSYNAYVDVNIENLGYTKLATWYGVCETLSGNDISMCAIKFAVFGDGNKLFESGTMKYNQPFEYAEVDLTGVKTFRLAIAGAPGIAGAWGIWGGAVLSKSGDVSDVSFYRELVIENPTTETDPPDETAETPTEPVTDAPTEPVPEAPTETSTETDESTETSTEMATASETEEKSGGCKATLVGPAILATGAAAFALAKRKEKIQ
jgi:hypothetical protein